MSELSGGETPDAQPERLDGAAYWEELTLILRGITASRKWQAELLERAHALDRHLSEPVSSPAIIDVPEGSQAFLTRNNQFLPGEPKDFVADGVEALNFDKLVLFNQEKSLWLVVPNPSSELGVKLDIPGEAGEQP